MVLWGIILIRKEDIDMRLKVIEISTEMHKKLKIYSANNDIAIKKIVDIAVKQFFDNKDKGE